MAAPKRQKPTKRVEIGLEIDVYEAIEDLLKRRPNLGNNPTDFSPSSDRGGPAEASAAQERLRQPTESRAHQGIIIKLIDIRFHPERPAGELLTEIEKAKGSGITSLAGPPQFQAQHAAPGARCQSPLSP